MHWSMNDHSTLPLTNLSPPVHFPLSFGTRTLLSGRSVTDFRINQLRFAKIRMRFPRVLLLLRFGGVGVCRNSSIREVFSRRFASYKLKDKIVMSPHRGTSLSANSRRWVIFLRLGCDRDRVVGNGPDPFALVRPHPRTAEPSEIFTTTGRILFYDS
jgi:hypothetical protein